MSSSADQIFRTTAETLSTLLRQNNKFFYIPAYQREFNWKAEKVQRLVEGAVRSLIELRRNNESFNFLGTIITIRDQEFRTVDAKHRPSLPANVLLLIDGQQRLTSLVLLVIALHSRLRKNYSRQKNLEDSVKTNLEKYIENETASTLNQIQDLVIHNEFIPPNSSIPFVRIIRAFEDSWSHDPQENIYESPIANLVYRYGITNEGFELSQPQRSVAPTAYPSPSNRNVCRTRYLELVRLLKDLHEDGIGEEKLKLPPVRILTDSPNVLKELFQNMGDDLKTEISTVNEDSELNQEISDLLFARFVLHRIVLTQVAVQNDDNAFDVFDALNTTGQPLAPFEMFKPLVMDAVGLKNYGASKEKIILDQIASKLGDLDNDANLTDARRIAVSFALAESGHRLGNDSVAQRNFYRVSYDRARKHPTNTDGLEYIQNLLTITNFHKAFFKDKPIQPQPTSPKISDVGLTCLSFLAKSKHTLTIPLLSQLWNSVVSAHDEQTKVLAIEEFEKVVKGITAFTVLFRAVSRGTEGIDQVYRDIMMGNKSPMSLGPLHRSNFDFYGNQVKTNGSSLLAKDILSDLLRRITDPDPHKGIIDRSEFVARAKNIPIYDISQPISRFLLFIAMHDSKYDSANPGLLVRDLPNSNSMLKLDEWLSEDALSVEHIAPQTRSNGWDQNLYHEQTVDVIGNLTLCPPKINSFLGNISWSEKRSVYKALNLANGLDDAKLKLTAAGSRFTNLAQALENNEVSRCKFFGNLGDKVDDWDSAYVDARSENFLGLIWDRLISWIQ